MYLSPQLELASVYPLAESILHALKPASVTIISSYHLASYINPSSTRSASAPILHLSTSPSSAIECLVKGSTILPFSPPNILHGLSSALLTVAALQHPGPEQSSTLLLFPSTSLPQPLNPPFPLSAPGEAESSDAFRDLGNAGGLWSAGLETVSKVAKELEWNRWWSARERGGKGFEWLDAQRKARRNEYSSSMYM